MHKTLIYIILSCMSIQACKVDVEPTDKYTDGMIWKNPKNTELYLYGMYGEFKRFSFGRYYSLGYNNATDALTDLMKYTSTSEGSGTANRLAFDPNRVNATSPTINYWADAYERIRRINEFIVEMKKNSTASEDSKQRFEAEARFIRAYVYFWLAKIHGSVILLEQATSEKNNPRASEDDVWNFIARDLEFAAQNLPEAWSSEYRGRITKGAAYGMLSRTWLYAASIAEYDNKLFNNDALTGVPASKKSDYYQRALNASQEVVKLNYSLEPKFSDVFFKKDSKEAILSIFYIRPAVTHDYDLYFALPGDLKGALVAGVPTAELVDEFELADGSTFNWNDASMASRPYDNREPRFYATVLYNGAKWKGRTVITAPGGEDGYIESNISSDPRKTVTGYYARKMLDEANTDIVNKKSDQPWVELRLSEVLLIQAESFTKLNDLNGAREALNKVRARAGLPGTNASSIEDMMKAIEHERKVELAFEGHRYWDLRRWRKAHIVLNKVRFHGHKPESSGTNYIYKTVDVDKQDRYFPSSFYYMPIPQVEIQRNTAINQITGW